MKLLGVLVAAVVAFAVWTNMSRWEYHYRLTLEFDTPSGPQSGSSVLRIRTRKSTWGLPETRGVRTALKGEAIFVDLKEGRNIVALLAGGDGGLRQEAMFRLPIFAFHLEKATWENQAAALSGPLTGKRAELSSHLLPTIVTFVNVNDAGSLQVLDPFALHATFGPGYRFKAAWVEMTTDRVTHGLETRLPWLSQPGRPVLATWRALTSSNRVKPAYSLAPEELFTKEF